MPLGWAGGGGATTRAQGARGLLGREQRHSPRLSDISV